MWNTGVRATLPPLETSIPETLMRTTFSSRTIAHISRRTSLLPSRHHTFSRPLITSAQPNKTFTTAKMPATARIANTVIAEADNYETVEGNVYFPPSSIKDKSILESSSLTTKCPWKGTASYYTLKVDGQTFKDAAWYYPEPMDKAKNIKDYVAFCKFLVPFPAGGWGVDANE
jgi:uncharacterized protein (DUF427 family)